ncbi:hypothetical protein DF185_09225 [Marinifilum breve]|uniref:Uncharacterized protein n=1 Tax=Marinifilum breve TaxID=2184082 RepID=A0A2V4A2S9_9BACT|nr:hypothetical protein [Marinifilum breve]PXY01640.1 hypothetical protein DF185_09225 [Marinifilum breve]
MVKKKDFTGGIDGLLRPSAKKTVKEKTDKEKSVKATYYYNQDQLQKIKAIAFYDRKPIGKVISEALDSYIESYPDLKKAIKILK